MLLPEQAGGVGEVLGHIDHDLVVDDLGRHQVTRSITRETANKHDVQVLGELSFGVLEALANLGNAGAGVGDRPGDHRQNFR